MSAENSWVVETCKERESMQVFRKSTARTQWLTGHGVSKERNFTVYRTLSREATVRTMQYRVVSEQAQMGQTNKASPWPPPDKSWFNSGTDPSGGVQAGLWASPEGPLSAKSTLAFLFAPLKNQIPGRILQNEPKPQMPPRNLRYCLITAC